MKNFVFHNPVKIYFGENQIATSLAKALSPYSRVMLLTGKDSIKKNGVYNQIREHAGSKIVAEFWGIEPNPEYETLMRAVSMAKEANVDFLLATGGGSVLDGTKFIAAALYFEGDPWDILAKQAKITKAMPLGSILTLPATGSEMNCGAVISRRAQGLKLSFGSPHVYPVFSILDPTTTYTLPPRQVTNGIVDAFTHVAEQYLTTLEKGNELQDRFAESILQTLIEIAPRTLSEPTNYQARATMFWCTTMALNGIISTGVPEDWATHLIGHELTALYGLDHAQTLAIVLPHLLEVQKDLRQAKLAHMAKRVFNIAAGSETELAQRGIDAIRSFFESINAPTKLSRYNIEKTPAAQEKIFENLKRNYGFPLGEMQDVSEERVRKIIENLW